MSDIGFYGIVAGLVGMAMLVVSGAALLIEAFVWRKRRGLPRRRWHHAAFVAPVIYALLGLVVLGLADRGSLAVRDALDVLAPIAAGIGLALWVGVRAAMARNR
jgi:hypothetical protein